ALGRQILEDVALASVHDDRAWRHQDDKVFGGASLAVGAAARFAVLGAPVPPMRQAGEAVDACLSAQDHMSAVAAVAAVGAAARHELFATKAQGAVAPFAGLNLDFYAIHKHADSNSSSQRRSKGYCTMLCNKKR